jgi:hypothetical protein
MENEWSKTIDRLAVENNTLKLQLTDAITKEETSENRGFWKGSIYTLIILTILLSLLLVIKHC